MEVSNYMYDEYNERGMKAFELRIKKILRGKDIKEFTCHDAWMERGSGYGSYYRCIDYSIDGEMTTLSSHTNDSMAWDDFGQTNKERRQLFEAVLTDNIYKL